MPRRRAVLTVLTGGVFAALVGLAHQPHPVLAGPPPSGSSPASAAHDRAAAAVPGVVSSESLGAPIAAAPPFAPRPEVIARVLRIDRELRWSRYSHSTRVDERAGSYEFDCSGLIAWVLARSAPAAHRAVMARVGGAGRPLARDYYRHFAAAPTARPRGGWLRVARVADALPGDVLAWLRPREVLSQNTGHVVFVTEPPRPVEAMPGAFLLRVADASSYQHQDDSRAGTGRTGFGFGTILVVADPVTGGPVSYGWFGAQSRWVLSTAMAIGRPVR